MNSYIFPFFKSLLNYNLQPLMPLKTCANPSNKSLVSPALFLIIARHFLLALDNTFSFDNVDRARLINCFIPKVLDVEVFLVHPMKLFGG